MGLLSFLDTTSRALKDGLGRLVDPIGPLGEVASPSDVYKTRMGLPVSSPHTQRAEIATTAAVEKTLAPARFVPIAEAVDVPATRVRQLSAFIEEVWQPVHGTTGSTDLGTILIASQTLTGWRVTQRQRSAWCDCTTAHFELTGGEYVDRGCGRARQRLSDEQFIEIAVNAQIQASDDFYNGYAETIPGNDPVILDGQILRGEPTFDANGKMTHDGIIRGGTNITRGRAQHREVTKGMVFWDKGALKEREKALAAEALRPVQNVRRAMESYKGELPMHNPVGINFRRDRRSAV